MIDKKLLAMSGILTRFLFKGVLLCKEVIWNIPVSPEDMWSVQWIKKELVRRARPIVNTKKTPFSILHSCIKDHTMATQSYHRRTSSNNYFHFQGPFCSARCIATLQGPSRDTRAPDDERGPSTQAGRAASSSKELLARRPLMGPQCWARTTSQGRVMKRIKRRIHR